MDRSHAHLAQRLQSAPASLAASRENLMGEKTTTSRSSTPCADFVNKRFSADLSQLDHHELMSHGGAGGGVKAHPGKSCGVVICL